MDIHEIATAFNDAMEKFTEVYPDTGIRSVSIEQNDNGIHVDIVPVLLRSIKLECTINDNGMEVLMPKKEPRYSLEYLSESLSKDIPGLEQQLGENYLTVFLPGNLKKRRHPVTIANRTCIIQRVGIDWVTGQPMQPPTFKSKKNNKASFRYAIQGNAAHIDSNGLFVTRRLGYIKIASSCRFCEGKWKNITFKRSASGKWYVKICVETKEPEKIQNGKAIGIDWNCSDDSFLTMSDGTKVKCPRFLKRKERQLEKYQQIQSRRFVKGRQEQSKRYQKARMKVARLHEKVANQRKDWLHKVSRDLANKYQYVFVEDIDLKKMSSELEHGKTVGDQGFGLLRQYLAYKTNLVKVPAEYTSKTCHTCGNINPEVVLGVKQWVCPTCSTEHDRDVNAAQNILYLGVKRTLGREPTEVHKNARLQNRECPKPSVELSTVS